MSKLIPLTRGLWAIVDDQDFNELAAYRWSASANGRGGYYAQRSIKGDDQRKHVLRMHRAVLKSTDSPKIDHTNGDGLDNRRNNLRPATASQNGANHRLSRRNTSGYYGVAWGKQQQGWIARLTYNRQKIHIGVYADPRVAALAYDAAATYFFGEFASLNFRDGEMERAAIEFTPRITATCLTCRKCFDSGDKKKTCLESCRLKRSKGRARVQGSCIVCGGNFEGLACRRYCSSACRSVIRNDSKRDRRAKRRAAAPAQAAEGVTDE